MTLARNVRSGLFGTSIGRLLCIAVAGLALLGTSATAMADQNGRRDRGVQFVKHKDGRQARSHHRGHGHANHGHHDRSHRRHGHASHDRHDRRHHGHGHHRGKSRGHRHGKSHKHIDIHIGGTIVHGHRGHRHVVYRKPARPTYAQIEYERGVTDARYAGFEAGKADAINWRPHHDDLNVCLDHVSRYYRAGYLDAYEQAYHQGYAAGERARQTVRLRYGNRSVRYRNSCRW